MVSDLEPERSVDRYLSPSLALAGLSVWLCGPRSFARCVVPEGGALRIGEHGGTRIPVDERGEMLINYHHRFDFELEPEDGAPVAVHGRDRGPLEVVYFSMTRAGGGRFFSATGEPVEPARLSGQVVLVVDGRELPVQRTPFGPHHPQSTVHAQILSNVLENDYLRPVPIPGIVLAVSISLALALLARLKLAQRPRTLPGWVPAAGVPLWQLASGLVRIPELWLIALWFSAAVTLFLLAGRWLPVVFPAGALAGGALGALGVEPIAMRRQLETLRRERDERGRAERALQERIASAQADLEAVQALRREAAAHDQLTPEERAALAIEPGELEALEAVIEMTLVLVGQSPEARPRAAGDRPVVAEAALRRLATARDELHALRDRVEETRRRVQALLPSMQLHARLGEARLAGYVSVLERMQQSFRETARSMEQLRSLPLRPAPAGAIVLDACDTRLCDDTGIVTRDPMLIEQLHTILELAERGEGTLLVLGDSGTGKEVVARAIHRRSGRREGPFVAVNVAAIPSGLFESEMFGHEKGAFSGAMARHIGYFEQAQGGTIFLDEIGDLPLELQVKILRVLQERELRRVGGVETIRLSIRVVAATRHSLLSRVEQGLFREDLYYRLAIAAPLVLPPLRERRWDIAPLAFHFLRKAGEERKEPLRFGAGVLELMCGYAWPGNIRELELFVRDYLAPLARGGEVPAELVASRLGSSLPGGSQVPGAAGDVRRGSNERPLEAGLSPKLQRALQALRRHRFDYKAAASDEGYGVSPPTSSKHFCALRAIALRRAGWRIEPAAALLAGEAGEGARSAVERLLREFVSGQRARVREHATAEGWGRLERSVKREYEADAPEIMALLVALREEEERIDHR
jgi:transcriptional regulator with PAS, ATPase and Fis domain